MTFLPIYRYADIGDCRYFHLRGFDMSLNADIQISALKMFADSRYADIEKKVPILPMPI